MRALDLLYLDKWLCELKSESARNSRKREYLYLKQIMYWEGNRAGRIGLQLRVECVENTWKVQFGRNGKINLCVCRSSYRWGHSLGLWFNLKLNKVKEKPKVRLMVRIKIETGQNQSERSVDCHPSSHVKSRDYHPLNHNTDILAVWKR